MKTGMIFIGKLTKSTEWQNHQNFMEFKLLANINLYTASLDNPLSRAYVTGNYFNWGNLKELVVKRINDSIEIAHLLFDSGYAQLRIEGKD